MVTNLKKFHSAWNNYEIAAHPKISQNSGANKLKNNLRTATLLTFIRSDALDVYEDLEFENEDNKGIAIVLQKLQSYCISQTNEIYERYRFNRRDQEANKSLDA